MDTKQLTITVLVENFSEREDLRAEHGLSLVLETDDQMILFDSGASDAFWENADTLGIDLKRVNRMFLSHGHYDHGGGIGTFLERNETALIYAHPQVFEEHVSCSKEGCFQEIGIPRKWKEHPRFRLLQGDHVIETGLIVFSEIATGKAIGLNGETANRPPSGNQTLYRKKEGLFEQDDFAHEQCLVIWVDGISVFLTGCSHCGIVNLLEHFYHVYHKYPDVVIGGFHLYSKGTGVSEPTEIVTELATHLRKSGARFYTCHCTGTESYQLLKELLGDQISYCVTGQKIVIQE